MNKVKKPTWLEIAALTLAFALVGGCIGAGIGMVARIRENAREVREARAFQPFLASLPLSTMERGTAHQVVKAFEKAAQGRSMIRIFRAADMTDEDIIKMLRIIKELGERTPASQNLSEMEQIKLAAHCMVEEMETTPEGRELLRVRRANGLADADILKPMTVKKESAAPHNPPILEQQTALARQGVTN